MYKFWNVLIVYILLMSIRISIFFFLRWLRMREHKAYYVHIVLCIVIVLINSKKKTDLSFSLGKKLKSYNTIALLSIFFLGKGRETLMPQTLLKTLKILQSVLSDQKPLQHTSLDLWCVCDTPQNCPIVQNYMYILSTNFAPFQ